MNEEKLNEAQILYDAGKYSEALALFLEIANSSDDPNGFACHMAGNCYMRLRQYSDACDIYRLGLTDLTYTKQGALRANLGTALTCLGEYRQAVLEFEYALLDPNYPTPYKAYSGMAGALMKSDRIEEAGVAYRKAALCDGNPDPAKSLVNLGICFMALHRPEDAAEAYKAALGFKAYAGRGKVFANLGQSYVKMGQWGDAVSSFEKSVNEYHQVLSPAASKDFERAQQALLGNISEMPSEEFEEQIHEIVPSELNPNDTGVIPAASESMTNFFSLTEEEMRDIDRENRKLERRDSKTGVKVVVTVIVVIVLLVAALTAAFFLGFGTPSQGSTISGMISTHAKGGDVSSYWVAKPQVDSVRAMMAVPSVNKVTIESLEKGTLESNAIISIPLENNSKIQYKVTLQREGVGWKISNLETYFSSNSSGAATNN